MAGLTKPSILSHTFPHTSLFSCKTLLLKKKYKHLLSQARFLHLSEGGGKKKKRGEALCVFLMYWRSCVLFVVL